MNSVSKHSQKDTDEFIAKINAEATVQRKTPIMYLAEQDDGLRQMFIRWLKADIKHLESIKSLHK